MKPDSNQKQQQTKAPEPSNGFGQLEHVWLPDYYCKPDG